MKYIIANWKMNKTEKEALNFLNIFKKTKPNKNNKIIIAPPHTLLSSLKNKITLAAQNINHNQNGAQTGEISAEQVKEFADYVILGHSERKENRALVNKKIEQALNHNLIPIICISKPTDLKALPKLKDAIIAYEPISAIGTGKTPEINHIKQAIAKIKQTTNLKAIYGGSVNENNATEILKVSDGLLIGTASLDPLKLAKIATF